MKKILIVVLTAVVFGGCGMLQAGRSDSTEANGSATDSTKIKPGDMVVAKWSSGSFYEGKVEKVDDTKITVAWLDKSKPSDVDAVDVYPMPAPGSSSDAKAQDMVLTKTTATGTYWIGAEITGVEGEVFKVRPVSSTASVNVPAEKIIKVSSATAADFRDKAGATDFLKDAQVRKPTVPTDYRPTKGSKVVAEWSRNSWHSGKIDNISGTNIYVAWDDGSKPSAVNSEKVMPMPTGQNSKIPAENQYLLIKPERGHKWQYSQASSINGNSVEAKLPDGSTRMVKLNEFILLD